LHEIAARRRRELLEQLSDYIVSVVEDDIYLNRMSKEEGQWLYRTVGHRGVRDLINRWVGLTNRQRKEQSMPKNVIVYKEADKSLPTEYLDNALAIADKSIGWALAIDGTLYVNKDTVDKAVIEDHLKKFGESHVVFCLSDVETEKAQPFTVLGSDDEPVIVGFLQGDDSVLPELFKKIAKLHSLEEDFEKFWEGLSEDDLPTIKKVLKDNSCLVLMNNTGEIIFIQHEGVEKRYDWGSYVPPYNESNAPAGDEHKGVKADPFAKTNNDNNKREKRPVTEGVPLLKVAKQDFSKCHPELRKRLKDSGAVDFLDEYELFVRCPEMFDGKKTTKPDNVKWHLDVIGVRPENWESKPLIPVGVLLPKPKVDLKGVSAATLASVTEANKDMPTRVSDAMVKDFDSTLARILGPNSVAIQDPEKMFLEDEKEVTIAGRIGKVHTWELRLPRFLRQGVCKEHPEVAAELWGNFQLLCRDNMKRITSLEENVANQEKELEDAKNEIKQLKEELEKAKGGKKNPFGK
jgi:hypothetical protein